MMKNQYVRVVFYLHTLIKRVILIFYYIVKKFNKWQIGDIGGKTDIGDKCLFDTLRRECKEETNGKLFGNNVKRFNSNFNNLLQNSIKFLC